MEQKTIQLIGMLTISFGEQGNSFIQFAADEIVSLEIDSILFEGSGQLLRSGQFDFISSKVKILNAN